MIRVRVRVMIRVSVRVMIRVRVRVMIRVRVRVRVQVLGYRSFLGYDSLVPLKSTPLVIKLGKLHILGRWSNGNVTSETLSSIFECRIHRRAWKLCAAVEVQL